MSFIPVFYIYSFKQGPRNPRLGIYIRSVVPGGIADQVSYTSFFQLFSVKLRTMRQDC